MKQIDTAGRRLLDELFTKQKSRKLHIGCGENFLNGWLNADLEPESANILRLDATGTFPFDNNELDYIFGEHMIEHITYAEGSLMLTECHRVLRKSGKIRISTPNLSFLIDLYKSEKSELQKAYLKWVTDEFIPTMPYYDDTFVINNFVRNWGHLFIYDEKTLRYSMEKAGFTEITKCDLNESEHEALRNLENEGRMPEGFLKLETVTLEGTK